MVARNTSRNAAPAGKPNQRALLSDYRAAKLLGVSRSHLSRVIRGLRDSKTLLARYQALRAGSGL